MAFSQLLKCVKCRSNNEFTRRKLFSFSIVNEISENVDQENFQQFNEETKDTLPGLTKKEADDAFSEIWNQLVESKKIVYEKELNERTFIHTPSGKLFRWSQGINNGNWPVTGRSLWILMNNYEKSINDEDIKLNDDGSIWVVPRCSTDWQQEYIDLMLDRLIGHLTIVNEVNTNRVFLIGISSSGGDGVFQLAPRMADRLAAASVINSHPNSVSPLNLRNLPFAISMTGQNSSDKNKSAARVWTQSLEQHSRESFNDGYHYRIKIGKLEKQRHDTIVWMNNHSRNPWPTRIVWCHRGYLSEKRFYWLALPIAGQVKNGETIVAEVRNRKNIYLEQIPEEIKALAIRLSDKLVNLDQTVTVSINRETTTTKIFHGIVPRTRTAIEQSLEERTDPMSVATALLHVIWSSNGSIVSCHSPANTELACPVCCLRM
ncbi:unnamed protein product [Rotaria socialis]|uniref:Uncharacterized protein n=3 Tax=Rotaria socialis TaxID=392032 RepID=A0A819VF28_9BILA|nr:unnamed protein product [Rotaria socialis]CAF3532516.1 unnamed protein product [Rotaria socialis]CAF3582158.1 unnamed protein product [Rotaria socialis]CAF3670665.1 unnamed protein product [Rotaria socialis]CAF4107874.1 unnamed protein product [Rotaria socialis]